MAGEYQPIDYSGGNGFLQGLQGAGLYQQVQQQRAQAEQAKQQQAAQQAFQQDWQKAYSSGDPQQLDAIIAKYPGQMETVQKAIGFRDDNHRMALGNTARDLRVAMQSGNPGAIAQAAQKNASALESIGSSPQEFMQMYQQDPQGAMQTVDTVGMGALGVKDYYGVQNDQQQRQIDRDKLTETVRSNQAGEGLQARGQDITLRGQNISAQNSSLDREIKRAELHDKALDRQISRETNQVKLDGLRQQQVANQQKVEDAKLAKQQTAQQTYDTFNTALDTVAELKQSPGLKGAVGMPSMLWSRPGGDAATFEAKLDTFKAQTFLPMVQSMKGMGALSDAEGKKLTDAVGALDPKMSEKEFTKSLDRIEGQLRGKLANAQKTFGVPMQQAQSAPTPEQQGGGFSTLWGE